jgi:hypothetical protein
MTTLKVTEQAHRATRFSKLKGRGATRQVPARAAARVIQPAANDIDNLAPARATHATV